ncbi:MAG: winged helix-turn-helix domain-containing protein [Myxococcaceae bacterium]
MTTKIPETLDAKIEQLVREHLAMQQAAARAAVERAFAASMPARAASRRRATYTRRASSTMAELAEHLFEAVQACPGETMTVIAARVGKEARALHRPMTHLKDAGRVRSAGERNYTRYFPMGAARSA